MNARSGRHVIFLARSGPSFRFPAPKVFGAGTTPEGDRPCVQQLHRILNARLFCIKEDPGWTDPAWGRRAGAGGLTINSQQCGHSHFWSPPDFNLPLPREIGNRKWGY